MGQQGSPWHVQELKEPTPSARGPQGIQGSLSSLLRMQSHGEGLKGLYPGIQATNGGLAETDRKTHLKEKRFYKAIKTLNPQQNISFNSLRKTKDLNRHFPKEHTQMANGHLGRCSTSLGTREMHTKPQGHTTSHLLQWYYLKKQTITNAGEAVDKSKSLCPAGGNVKLCSHLGTVW